MSEFLPMMFVDSAISGSWMGLSPRHLLYPPHHCPSTIFSSPLSRWDYTLLNSRPRPSLVTSVLLTDMTGAATLDKSMETHTLSAKNQNPFIAMFLLRLVSELPPSASFASSLAVVPTLGLRPLLLLCPRLRLPVSIRRLPHTNTPSPWSTPRTPSCENLPFFRRTLKRQWSPPPDHFVPNLFVI